MLKVSTEEMYLTGLRVDLTGTFLHLLIFHLVIRYETYSVDDDRMKPATECF